MERLFLPLLLIFSLSLQAQGPEFLISGEAFIPCGDIMLGRQLALNRAIADFALKMGGHFQAFNSLENGTHKYQVNLLTFMDIKNVDILSCRHSGNTMSCQARVKLGQRKVSYKGNKEKIPYPSECWKKEGLQLCFNLGESSSMNWQDRVLYKGNWRIQITREKGKVRWEHFSKSFNVIGLGINEKQAKEGALKQLYKKLQDDEQVLRRWRREKDRVIQKYRYCDLKGLRGLEPRENGEDLYLLIPSNLSK